MNFMDIVEIFGIVLFGLAIGLDEILMAIVSVFLIAGAHTVKISRLNQAMDEYIQVQHEGS